MVFFNTKDAGPIAIDVPSTSTNVTGLVGDRVRSGDARANQELESRKSSIERQEKCRWFGGHLFRTECAIRQRSNWIPTNPAGGFEVLFRLYGPEKPQFEKTWRLPEIEEIENP